MAKHRGGYTYRVTYTHDRAAGLTYSYVVLAWSVEHAKMYAGMARAESMAGWFVKRFFRSPVKWEIVSVERIR